MKKTTAIFAAAALAAAMSLGISACGGDDGAVTVYMPDGAPALALAQLMVDEPDLGADVSYRVVDASTIQTYVTGDMKADVCVLPVNAAATVAGDGSEYTMLGVVTHGNLYMVSSKYGEQITGDNLTSLVGKTVGCIQLNSFVGAVFKAVLGDAGIGYTVVADAAQASPDSVNLINIANPASEISPSAEFDYMIAAEPVVTAKTSGGDLGVVGDLQALYGEGGYPQAVMIAKNSLIESDPEFIRALVDAVAEGAQKLVSDGADIASIIEAVNANGGAGTLTAGNLKPETLKRCAIAFEAAADAKSDVLSFIAKYNAVTNMSLSLSDAFFYSGNR